MDNGSTQFEPSQYEIAYSGSTWGGEPPVKENVNTLEKIFGVAEVHKFEDFTSIFKVKNRRQWVFSGNLKTLSCVFSVAIYDSRMAGRIKSRLRNKAKYF